MKALVLSGGLGTRLYPLTFTLAKQLVPVANKPVLIRVIESIRDAGITDIGIVVGVTGDQIRQALGDGSQWNVQLTYIDQMEPKGLANAVQTASDFLGDESFVMFLGDNVIEGGITRLVQEFQANDWNSQIVLKAVDDARAYGVAELNDKGQIIRLVEKPANPPSNLALVGIYMFDANIIEAVNNIEPSPRDEYEITDAIQWLLEHEYTVYPHIHTGWWIDTGKPTDMLKANRHVLRELVPSVDETAEIDARSEVDPWVTIEAGARIVNSTIWGPTIIGRNALIENSHIGPYTSIHHDVVISNVEIQQCIVLEESEVRDVELLVRDSLIGRRARIRRSNAVRRGMVCNVGDHSELWV